MVRLYFCEIGEIYFSRLCAMNDWLVKLSSNNCSFKVIDNTDFFQNSYLFNKTKNNLSTAGVYTLQERITKYLANANKTQKE